MGRKMTDSSASETAMDAPDKAPGSGGGRLSGVMAWLRGRTETSLGRLALLWFHRDFEASRNSGAERPPTARCR